MKHQGTSGIVMPGKAVARSFPKRANVRVTGMTDCRTGRGRTMPRSTLTRGNRGKKRENLKLMAFFLDRPLLYDRTNTLLNILFHPSGRLENGHLDAVFLLLGP
jgi:hypothetical protein